MGKPRLIILVRHAQSEGNKDRGIHQVVPDHRVKLTDEGWKQAEDAGRRLRNILKPDDTLQIFTSPYRRTRETTEGILKTLTAYSDPDDPDAAPSPFTREKIKVWEEPRLREQDFGNFQPDSTEMERMWKERADYGHFFYRIPNGESAADAYDRVSGFNESLWRQFGEKEFPSVLVLVTHGLMTRVFLMKWYHWSVEYFEDLRNVNHCEFVVMKQNPDSGKYTLESQLRTWSELKRQRANERAEEARNNPTRRNTLSAFLTTAQAQPQPQSVPPRQWPSQGRKPSQAQDAESKDPARNEAEDHPIGAEQAQTSTSTDGTAESTSNGVSASEQIAATDFRPPPRSKPSHLTRSGTATPHEMPSPNDDEDEQDGYFDKPPQPGRAMIATAMRKAPERKPTPEDIERWVNESGMGRNRQADALGDEPAPEEDVHDHEERDRSARGSVY